MARFQILGNIDFLSRESGDHLLRPVQEIKHFASFTRLLPKMRLPRILGPFDGFNDEFEAGDIGEPSKRVLVKL